jgi:hypothetical protein
MWLINRSAYKVILAIIFLLAGIPAAASGQAKQPDAADGVYGGIEVSPEGVTAVALRVSRNEGEADFKLAYSEVVRLALWRRSDGAFAPQASAKAAQAVSAALARLKREYRAAPDHIYLIGSSRLGADRPADLVGAIKEATGLTLTFLEEETEVQLKIAGTVPKVGREGAAAIDSRNTSALMHIGAASVYGGYELLRYSQSSGPAVDFAAVNVPQGVMSYEHEISRVVGPNANLSAFTQEVKASGAKAFRQALRSEIESKPGLMHRKRVFLTGNMVWAVATMLYPGDRQPFIPLTHDDVAQFAERIARTPKELAYQNLSFIRDLRLRQEVQQEFEAIRATFTPQQLIAGAELLRAASEELKWQDKKILFARLGHFGGILSYVRLQTGL